MGKLRLPSVVVALLIAFGNGAWADSDARWFFAVEGMPEIRGSTIVKMGMGTNFRYTAASSGATVNLSMPAAALMIKYGEPKIICAKSGNTVVVVDGDRAVFSGTVHCFTQVTRANDRKEVAIEGWFDLAD